MVEVVAEELWLEEVSSKEVSLDESLAGNGRTCSSSHGSYGSLMENGRHSRQDDGRKPGRIGSVGSTGFHKRGA